MSETTCTLSMERDDDQNFRVTVSVGLDGGNVEGNVEGIAWGGPDVLHVELNRRPSEMPERLAMRILTAAYLYLDQYVTEYDGYFQRTVNFEKWLHSQLRETHARAAMQLLLPAGAAESGPDFCLDPARSWLIRLVPDCGSPRTSFTCSVSLNESGSSSAMAAQITVSPVEELIFMSAPRNEALLPDAMVKTIVAAVYSRLAPRLGVGELAEIKEQVDPERFLARVYPQNFSEIVALTQRAIRTFCL